MAKTALIVLDLQRGILSQLDNANEYLSRVSATITAARHARVQIIHVTTGFRPGHPECSPRNAVFSQLTAAGAFIEGSTEAEVHPDVVPIDGDVVVTKRRVSAFAGTDMEVVLRSLGVEDLVLLGLATSGGILSTVQQAADLDYRLTVLEDGCSDLDSEVHRVLMEKVFPRQATVLTLKDWKASLRSE